MSDDLDALLAANGLPPARTVERVSTGRNNSIYVVDDAYVMRFDGLTGSDPEYTTRFRAEQWVYEKLFAAGLPVPRVLRVDDTRALAAEPYMLMTKIAGRAVADSAELAPPQRLAVARQYGAFLARMHGVVNFDRFGKWYQLQDGTPLARWADWPVAFFEHYADWSDALGGAADAALVRDLRQLLVETQPDFEAVTVGVIAHRDAHPGNVLQSAGTLTGVIDFEWWMAADPAMDFAVIDQWESFCAGSTDAVYEAYTALRPLTVGHRRKAHVYNLLRHFDSVVSDYADGRFESSRQAAAVLRAGLDKV